MGPEMEWHLMARKRLSFTTRYVLAFGILMLIANAVLGMIILHQSGTAMKSLIDKNMLDDHGGTNRIIMKSIVSMCRQMGVHTLAEGIETEEQYQFLISIDCEMVQGFCFFRPEPLETLGERLKTDHARTCQDA